MKKFLSVKVIVVFLAIGLSAPNISFARRIQNISQGSDRFITVDGDLGLRRGALSKHRKEIKAVLKHRLIGLISQQMISSDITWRTSLSEYVDIAANSLVHFKEGSLEQLRFAGLITEEMEVFLSDIDDFSVQDARDIELDSFAERVVRLINGYYNNPLGEFTQEQISLCLKKFISWQDIQWLAEEFDISRSDAMHAVMDHSNPREWLQERVPLAEALAEEFEISRYDAMSAVMRHSNPREWLEKR